MKLIFSQSRLNQISFKKVLLFLAILTLHVHSKKQLNAATVTTTTPATKSVTGTSSNSLNYKIPFKFPTSVYNKYRLTETTKVKRIFSDSTSLEYERNYTYHFFLRSISFPADGFQKVFVSFDSLDYYFKSGDKVIRYNDQDDEAVPPLNERDFLLFMQPLGKTFDAIYSNYGQVGKIEGEDLDEKRNMIKNDITKYENPERLLAILDKLSDQELIKLFDPLKNILPVFNVNFDTTWTRAINWNVDVFKCSSEAKIKLSDYRNNHYQLTAKIDSLTTSQTTFRVPDLNKEAELEDFKGKGIYTLDISNQGAPAYGKAVFNYQTKGKITNTTFVQEGETTLIWDLIGRTSY